MASSPLPLPVGATRAAPLPLSQPGVVKWDWIEEQKAVLRAGASERLLVEAAPGTGKTEVACGRAVRLVMEEDVPASAILMVSFTRTAVAEMRKRMQRMLPDGRAHAINIATLDQTAFSFGIGCGAEFSALMGSFEGNIDNALQALAAKTPLLLDYLGRLRHVIVDEAQDITGVRARFMDLVLRSLGTGTGATVFADRAQSIFGFTSDTDDEGRPEQDFMQLFDFKAVGFIPLALVQNHRCGTPELRNLFDCSRRSLGGSGTRTERVDRVIEVVKGAAKNDGSEVQELPLADGDLVLYRKRGSALMSAQFCPGIYRMRMTGYPAAVFPWIAGVLSSWTASTISAAEFAERWKELPAALRTSHDEAAAWHLLYQFGGNRRGEVDILAVRGLVARPRPPVELCMLDCGGHGPIFSTIHASKGREADRVFVMLPRNLDYLETDGGKKINADEEARVFYVGSTRMRKELRRGTALTMVGAKAMVPGSRRVVHMPGYKPPKVQLCMEDDLAEEAPVSRGTEYCADPEAAAAAQLRLIQLWSEALASGKGLEVQGLLTSVGGEPTYKFLCKGAVIAWADAALMGDLRRIAEIRRRRMSWSSLRPPAELKPLRLTGLRTAAIPEGPVHEGRLHEPYATSGFLLAPIICGFPTAFIEFDKQP
jgi:hypothetical protein